MKIYLGNFTCLGDVEREFSVQLPKDIKIIFACYDTPPYEGYATVLFKEGEAYYIVEGGHCSCYGLEGQWKPEGINLDYIKHRSVKGGWVGYDGEGEYEARIKEILKENGLIDNV